MIVCVTGTPATGKTVVAKKIAKQIKANYIDINKIISKHKLIDGYDKKRKSKIIDIKKLNKVLIDLIKKSKNNLVIDSHLSHYLNKKYVDLCIVTKCDLKVLQERLKKRGYSKDKIRENLDAEIFDICLNEAKEKGHNILVVDTTKGLKSLNFLDNI